MPILHTETVTWTRNLQIHCIQGAMLTYVSYHSVLRLKGERALQRSRTRVHQRRNMRRRGNDGNQDGRRPGYLCSSAHVYNTNERAFDSTNDSADSGE